MSETTCPGCPDRETLLARIELLEQRIRDLETRLGQNSSNSSMPPSQNPLHANSPQAHKRKRRKRAGQHGDKGHHRVRPDASRVRHVIALVPTRGENCSAALPAVAQPGDPQPTWHQVVELPRMPVVVTEFQGHARTCPCCQHVTR